MNNLDKYKTTSDEQLLALSSSDHSAFAVLVNRYSSRILNFILRMSNLSYQEAEDLLQDIFLKVYLNLNSFDNDLKFSSWLYSIARNQIISNYRKIKSRPEGNLYTVEEKTLENIVVDLDLEGDLDIAILNKQIFASFNELKAKWKEVLVLKFFEEKSYEEISDIIKKPTGTVASMLNKAKKEFSEKYNKLYNK